MSVSKLAARVILGYVGLVEGAAALTRHRERTRVYQAAAQRAAVLGRQLLVIGDPDAGFHTRLMRAYGCGDVCVDLNGCARGAQSRGSPTSPTAPSPTLPALQPRGRRGVGAFARGRPWLTTAGFSPAQLRGSRLLLSCPCWGVVGWGRSRWAPSRLPPATSGEPLLRS